jgi:hypothetical protein
VTCVVLVLNLGLVPTTAVARLLIREGQGPREAQGFAAPVERRLDGRSRAAQFHNRDTIQQAQHKEQPHHISWSNKITSPPLSPHEHYTRRRAVAAGASSPPFSLTKSCAACGTIGHATEDCPHLRGRAVAGNAMYNSAAKAMAGRFGSVFGKAHAPRRHPTSGAQLFVGGVWHMSYIMH